MTFLWGTLDLLTLVRIQAGQPDNGYENGREPIRRVIGRLWEFPSV
jgi:hypothetical protein